MKSKKEIEKIAIKCYTEKDNIVPSIVETESFIYGYQQCQENMAKKIIAWLSDKDYLERILKQK
jgi:hypothetical protein